MRYPLTGSIVAYHNDRKILGDAIKSFLNTRVDLKLFIVDNSANDSIRDMCGDPRCEYIYNGANLGFGKAHNIALRKAMVESEYHLVLNPDVNFKEGTIEQLLEVMKLDEQIGMIIPKVLDFESNIQYVCKRLPSPIDLIVRRLRLGFLNAMLTRRLNRYEMRDMDYSKSFEAPSLSGCFMLFRTSVLAEVGLFDERYFMYMEDIDLSRRIHSKFKTLYYPAAYIHHGHARESYGLNKLLLIHATSAIRYFNKWGWMFDHERNRMAKTLRDGK